MNKNLTKEEKDIIMKNIQSWNFLKHSEYIFMESDEISGELLYEFMGRLTKMKKNILEIEKIINKVPDGWYEKKEGTRGIDRSNSNSKFIYIESGQIKNID